MAKKILVIEDDQILHKAIKEALEIAEYEVISAFDGKDGKEKANMEKPDLILLDLILPREDGYHVLVDLHKTLPKTPIIIATVIDSKTSTEECMSNGAVDYLVKSKYSLKDIVKKVQKYCK